MNIERFSEIPATETSIAIVEDIVKDFLAYGIIKGDGPSMSAFRISPNELVFAISMNVKISEYLRPQTSYIVSLVEKNDEMTLAESYVFFQDGVKVSKINTFIPNIYESQENPNTQEFKEDLEISDLSAEQKELIIIGLKILGKHTQLTPEMKALEKEAGLNFVSEADLQGLIRKLRVIDPESQA